MPGKGLGLRPCAACKAIYTACGAHWTVANPGWFNRDIKNQAPWRAARRVSKKPAATTLQTYSAARGNTRRDGTEVSKRRSRWPGVGPLKG